MSVNRSYHAWVGGLLLRAFSDLSHFATGLLAGLHCFSTNIRDLWSQNSVLVPLSQGRASSPTTVGLGLLPMQYPHGKGLSCFSHPL